MKRKKVQRNKTLVNLKLWWLLLSGTTSKVITVLGLGVAVFLIAVSTGTGTNTTSVNAKQLNPSATIPATEEIPALTLILHPTTEKVAPTDNNFVEILASKKQVDTIIDAVVTNTRPAATPIVLAQSSTQSELQLLVNQAMNETDAEPSPVVPAPIPPPEPASNSTSDQLKALVNQTPASTAATEDAYISTLNAEVETTVVIDEKTAQQPATNSALSSSERLKLIQDIAARVAGDSSTTAANVEYVTVQENDSLWLIAKRIYGDAYQYKLLYKANRDILLNENSLVVGQQLRVPAITP